MKDARVVLVGSKAHEGLDLGPGIVPLHSQHYVLAALQYVAVVV